MALFRIVNRYVGNLPAMPSALPVWLAPVVRNADNRKREIAIGYGDRSLQGGKRKSL
jgi:hypothetical protein